VGCSESTSIASVGGGSVDNGTGIELSNTGRGVIPGHGSKASSSSGVLTAEVPPDSGGVVSLGVSGKAKGEIGLEPEGGAGSDEGRALLLRTAPRGDWNVT
jgi:hypothetical protein